MALWSPWLSTWTYIQLPEVSSAVQKVTGALDSLQRGPEHFFLSPEGLYPGAASLRNALGLLHTWLLHRELYHTYLHPFKIVLRLPWGVAGASKARNPDLKENSGKDRSARLPLVATHT